MKDIKISKLSPDNIEKEMDNLTVETVSLVGVTKLYKSRPYMATPVYEEAKKLFHYGLVDNIPTKIIDQIKSSTGFSIEKNKTYAMNNGDTLTLYRYKNEYVVNRDFLLYNLYLIQPAVAASEAEVKKRVHVFYLNNAELNAQEDVRRRRAVSKAYAALENASMKDWSDMLFFFGMNPLLYSSNVVEQRAFQKAEEMPEAVSSFFASKAANDRIVFVNKLLSHKLLTEDRNHYIMYDNQSIGSGVDGAANFLYEPANDRIFSALRGALDAIEGHRTAWHDEYWIV